MKFASAVGFASIFIVSLAANGFLYYKVNQANFYTNIEEKRGKINEDQLNDLLWTRMNDMQTQNVELARMQGYNEGIQAVAFNVPPHQNQISNIWHAGYNRGLEQTEFVGEMNYEKGYGAGFTMGQQENMKALSTIMKSGDNIQSALKQFMDNQLKNNENDAKTPEVKKESK